MAATRGRGAPALQMLVLRRTPDGIAAEPRTDPADVAAGHGRCSGPGLHSLRVAAGRLATAASSRWRPAS